MAPPPPSRQGLLPPSSASQVVEGAGGPASSSSGADVGARGQPCLEGAVDALRAAGRPGELTVGQVALEEGQDRLLHLHVDELDDGRITVGPVQAVRDHGQVVTQDRDGSVVDAGHGDVRRKGRVSPAVRSSATSTSIRRRRRRRRPLQLGLQHAP